VSRVCSLSKSGIGAVRASLRYGFRIFPNAQSQTHKYGELPLPSPPFPTILPLSINPNCNTKMKTTLKFLFWVGLCLTILILCDSCNITARKYKVGEKIVLRGTDTVQVIKVTKTTIKVRYTRKNGTHYEYTVQKSQ
jgi:hypothetical protein